MPTVHHHYVLSYNITALTVRGSKASNDDPTDIILNGLVHMEIIHRVHIEINGVQLDDAGH